MADDDDGDDGEDDGEDGDDGDEGDEEDSEMPDGERAESEAKTDRVSEAPPTVAKAEPSTESTPANVPTGAEPALAKEPSPPSNLSLPPPQPPHFEGSPLKNVVAAVSPTNLTPKLAPIEGDASAPATTTETLPSGLSLEPVPVPLLETLPPPVVPEAADVAKPDVEMLDVSYQPHTETIVQSTTDQGLQQSDVATVTDLPVVESTQVEVASTDHYSPPPPSTAAPKATSTEPSVENAISEPTVDTTANQESQPSNTAPVAADSVQPPVTIDTNVDAAALERVEENEPNSPDLFSGLEAALNQQGGPKEEAIVSETKADVPAAG